MKKPSLKNKNSQAATRLPNNLSAAARTPAQTAAKSAKHGPVRVDSWLRRTFAADSVVRGMLLVFAFYLPLIYDLSVPEVAGDIRWTATHLFAGVMALILLVRKIMRRETLWSARLPWIGLCAVVLIAWSALSMLDSLNVLRGIPMIKALFFQMILGFCAYAVWTPAFGRRLVWALCLPMGLEALIGAAQFFDWGDAKFAAMLGSTFGDWAQSMWVGLAGNVNILTVLPCFHNMPLPGGVLDGLVSCYQQSAVPGASFANKNLAGSWTAMMLPLIAYLMLTTHKPWRQVVASLLLAAGTLLLIYSRARASWVSVIFGFCALAGLVILVPAWRKILWAELSIATGPLTRRFGGAARLMLFIPAIVLGIWQFNVTSPNTTTYAINATPGSQMANLADANWDDVGGRLAYNLNSLMITKDYWFNGVGLGAFYVIYPAYHDALVPTPLNSYSVLARPQRTHTDMMEAFDETGIPGGLAFLGLFASAVFVAFGLVGRRAGKIGLLLLGLGYSGMVMGITVLLVHGGVVQEFPIGVLLGVGGLMVAMFATLVWLAFIRTDQRSSPMTVHSTRLGLALPEGLEAGDLLFGLFGGLAVLVLFTNCLMDFPLQLPTAPATVALLMGGIAWYGVKTGVATSRGLPWTLELGRPGLALAALLMAVALTVSLVDDYRFRAGNQILKAAMMRIMSGVTDDQTLDLINAAQNTYPYDPRIHEHMGVTYANYQGSRQMPLETRLAVLEMAISGDPWGANHLINAAGQYLMLADIQSQKGGNMQVAQQALNRAKELLARLKVSAGFSHYTYGIAGMVAMLEGHNDEAASDFNRALEIEPSYTPALNGLKRLQGAAITTPTTEPSSTKPRRVRRVMVVTPGDSPTEPAAPVEKTPAETSATAE